MPEPPKCFVAYTSAIPGGGDAIETAIESLNASGLVNVKGWKSLSIGGLLIIDRICAEIKQSDVFIADVTSLNSNVLFEVGFAIALGKRIWLLYSPSVATAKSDFDQFQLFTTIGYAPYTNSHNIVNAFYKDMPHEQSREPLLAQLFRNAPTDESSPGLLYIKPELQTEAVTRVTRRITASPIPAIIDDPEEIRVQSPNWYAQRVSSSYAVLCHFLSETHHAGAKISNAKNAFVAGLALGLDKPLLMLAHEPYQSPIDYRDLLRTHKDASMAVLFYEQWAKPLVADYETKRQEFAAYTVAKAKKARLLDLYLGEPVAEHESAQLEDYFVITAAYNEAMRSSFSIFVGRKGTGKTATLLKIAADTANDPRNHVCSIRPADYELTGVANLLGREGDRSDKSYLVDSFWKLLIYTELAKSVFEKIRARPPYHRKSTGEQALSDFVERNADLILPEFSTRLEAAVARLDGIEGLPEEKRKNLISEKLHSVMLGQLRTLIADALADANIVAILADNLDKSWTTTADLNSVSELLLGLLSASAKIAEEFQRRASGRTALNLRMVIFIRTDMYSVISKLAREKDKLPARKIVWNDSELLLRVIDERFAHVDKSNSPDQTWKKYFADSVSGQTTKEYMIRNIYPRPRDLIVLMKSMIDTAVDRGHEKVESRDVESALNNYSGFAFSTLSVEGTPRFNKFEDVLMGLMGGSSIITAENVDLALKAAGAEYNLEEFISFLCELNLLGYEVAENSFEFVYDPSEASRVVMRANRFQKKKDRQRYKIHNALHRFLDVNASSPEQLRILLTTDSEDLSYRGGD